jgi:hypothetical protein
MSVLVDKRSSFASPIFLKLMRAEIPYSVGECYARIGVSCGNEPGSGAQVYEGGGGKLCCVLPTYGEELSTDAPHRSATSVSFFARRNRQMMKLCLMKLISRFKTHFGLRSLSRNADPRFSAQQLTRCSALACARLWRRSAQLFLNFAE